MNVIGPCRRMFGGTDVNVKDYRRRERLLERLQPPQEAIPGKQANPKQENRYE